MEQIREIIESVVPQTPEEKARVRGNFNFERGYFGKELDHESPIIVCDCIAYLRHRALYEEGIFRIPGKALLVEGLKKAYNARYDKPLSKCEGDFSVLNRFKPPPSKHDVASLLKNFFLDLQEPLVGKSVREALCQIQAMNFENDKPSKIKIFSRIIKRMKSPNREVFAMLISFLRELTEFRQFNNMNANNLATCLTFPVFGKNEADNVMQILNVGSKVIEFIIQEPVKLSMPSVKNIRRNTRYRSTETRNTRVLEPQDLDDKAESLLKDKLKTGVVVVKAEFLHSDKSRPSAAERIERKHGSKISRTEEEPPAPPRKVKSKGPPAPPSRLRKSNIRAPVPPPRRMNRKSPVRQRNSRVPPSSPRPVRKNENAKEAKPSRGSKETDIF